MRGSSELGWGGAKGGIYYINFVVGASVELGVKMDRGNGGQKMDSETDYDDQGRLTVQGAIKALSNFSTKLRTIIIMTTPVLRQVVLPHLQEMETDFKMIERVLDNNLDLETKESVVASCSEMITVQVPVESIVNTVPQIRDLFQEVQYQCIVVASMVSDVDFEKYFDHQMERLEMLVSTYDPNDGNTFVTSIYKALQLCEQKMFSHFGGPQGQNRKLVIEDCEKFVEMFKTVENNNAREAMRSIDTLCKTILTKLGVKIDSGDTLTCRFCGKPKRVL